MSLLKIELRDLENEIRGETIFQNKRCIITSDFENPQKTYVYDSKTKKILFEFDWRGGVGDYFKVKKNGKVGVFCAVTSSIYIPLKYKDIDMKSFCKDTSFFARQLNDKIVLLDFYGERLNYYDYNYSNEFKDGLAVVGQIINNKFKYGVVLEDGTHLFECKYDNVLWNGANEIGRIKVDGIVKFFCKDSPKLFDEAIKINSSKFETDGSCKKTELVKYVLRNSITEEIFLYSTN